MEENHNQYIKRHIACLRKNKYETQRRALKAMKNCLNKRGFEPDTFGFYRCIYCGKFHLTSKKIKGETVPVPD